MLPTFRSKTTCRAAAGLLFPARETLHKLYRLIDNACRECVGSEGVTDEANDFLLFGVERQEEDDAPRGISHGNEAGVSVGALKKTYGAGVPEGRRWASAASAGADAAHSLHADLVQPVGSA